MAPHPKTIAQELAEVWPGFSIHPNQTVGELRQWIASEIQQLNAAMMILIDPSIVGPDGSAKLTDSALKR